MRPNDDTKKQRSTEVTKGELSKAIARGSVPYVRDGDQYVLRAADVRNLRAHREDQPASSPRRDTLEMGRSA